MKSNPCFIGLVALLLPLFGIGQAFEVLHYSETSGYDHGTRQNSLAMFQELGQQYDFDVVADQTGSEFDSLSNLENYEVVIFSNTSGDQILDSQQRAHFEQYMENGGAFLGIHAAGDTYRHSSANGSTTGTWDWYAEMMGASVQQNPNHTASNYSGTMDIEESHPTVNSVPDPWEKNEEYYYWEKGYFDTTVNPVLEVRPTGNESYDARRPISWYKVLPNGGRVFYTALGHANDDFTSNSAFRNHLKDAFLWTTNRSTSLKSENANVSLTVYPNPASDQLFIQFPGKQLLEGGKYRIWDVEGKIRKTGIIGQKRNGESIVIEELPSGRYWLGVQKFKAQVYRVSGFVVK